MFKVVREKMVNLILKDTNASVRDATVTLFFTFKTILSDDNLYPQVQEAINQLPKYRITEIAKKIAEQNPV